MKLYLKIKQLRISNGLTQAEFAKIAGVTPATICHYEAGAREPSLGILIKLANAFNVTIDDLVNKDFKKPRKLEFEALIGEEPSKIQLGDECGLDAIFKYSVYGPCVNEFEKMRVKGSIYKTSKWKFIMQEIIE